ncbi:hypothetical protein PENTCL1PPCAC_1757 [Pristionchus entomophagus]|uniref:Phytanoyl-CoA hydroxylase-interacting protein-like C-terminal domain-containing protein n=1 Tax=Pristionchus entomophagus TaxID=358040 RepID=A0AAV5SAH2_9BILA|nr:hypothetical protein PENTCL1PPCAC_1757 [Pristionchus entomophagus]
MNKDETREFLENAEMLIDPESMMPARFYRNNYIEDEIRIKNENGGCYELVPKHNSGHRASPLFGRFNGVYFSCRLREENDPRNRQDEGLPLGYMYPYHSPFGSNRRSFDTEKLLNERSSLFLGDMHCYLLPKHRILRITLIKAWYIEL